MSKGGGALQLIWDTDPIEKEKRDETKKVQGLRAVYPPTCLLPEVNVFQVAHSSQSTQIQTLHSVPGHG